jgi:homoserine kinase type II
MPADLEPARLAVLARYGAAVDGLRWTALGSAGGFSGACVWRGEDESGRPVLALKAWPSDGMTVERLTRIHGWMARAEHLPFVPVVLSTRQPSTVVFEMDRVWDLTRWMPGTADYHAHPTPARLANACAALARLHRAWAPPTQAFAPCPGVARRLRILGEWRSRLVGPAVPAEVCLAGTAGPTRCPDLEPPFRNAVAAVGQLAEPAERALRPWADRPVPVQPCLCDVWHDHVLFTGDTVTGVIDYGAMKDDHIAVDLARLLGDLVEDDAITFSAGLQSYQAAGGRLEMSAEFVRLLDRTGVVCGLITWLLRLAKPQAVPSPRAVVARLNRLAIRAGSIDQF